MRNLVHKLSFTHYSFIFGLAFFTCVECTIRITNVMGNQPVHVLHLIEPEHQYVGAMGTALLADLISVNHDTISKQKKDDLELSILILGGSAAEKSAHDLGINTDDRLTPPCQIPCMSLLPFRRYLKYINTPDVIHTWTLGSLFLATLAAPHIPRILMLTTPPESIKQAHWLRTIIHTDHVLGVNVAKTIILTFNRELRRVWGEMGGIEPRHIHVIYPGLNLNRLRSADTNRIQIRNTWGCNTTVNKPHNKCNAKPGQPRIVAVAGHGNGTIAADRVAHILILANKSGLNLKMIVPSTASKIHKAYDHIIAGGLEDNYLIVDDRCDTPWEIFPACDGVLWLAGDGGLPKHIASKNSTSPAYIYKQRDVPMPGILPLHWAAAAGCTLIAEATEEVAETYQHNHNALLSMPGSDVEIVRRLQRFCNDDELNWRLRSHARSEAFTLFSKSRFISDLRTAYMQIRSNDDINIPFSGFPNC